MPITILSPLAVLTGVGIAMVTMSHAEFTLDKLCAQQMVRNGFTHVQAANRCAKF